MKRDSLDHPDEGGGGLKHGKTLLLMGVCLKEQFLDKVPHGVDLGHHRDDGNGSPHHNGGGGIILVSDHDYLMDIVLTPTRTLTLCNVLSQP